MNRAEIKQAIAKRGFSVPRKSLSLLEKTTLKAKLTRRLPGFVFDLSASREDVIADVEMYIRKQGLARKARRESVKAKR